MSEEKAQGMNVAEAGLDPKLQAMTLYVADLAAADEPEIEDTPVDDAAPGEDDAGSGEQASDTQESPDAPETPEAPDAAQQAKPPVHGWDKALQKVQQEQANTRKAIATLLEKIDQRGGQPTQAQQQQITAIEQQVQQQQQAQKDLASLLEGVEDDDLVSAKQMREILKALPKSDGASGQLAELNARLDKFEQRVNDASSVADQIRAQRDYQDAVSKFDQQVKLDFPSLYDRKDELFAQVEREVLADYPQASADYQGVLMGDRFRNLCKSLAAKTASASAATAAATAKAKATPQTKPPTSTAGTRIHQSGASARVATNTPKTRAEDAIWEDD